MSRLADQQGRPAVKVRKPTLLAAAEYVLLSCSRAHNIKSLQLSHKVRFGPSRVRLLWFLLLVIRRRNLVPCPAGLARVCAVRGSHVAFPMNLRLGGVSPVSLSLSSEGVQNAYSISALTGT